MLNNSGVVESSSPGLDESHSTKPLDKNGSTLRENLPRKSTRVRSLTMREMDAFACGSFSPKSQRKGSEKTVNPDGCHMKSVSRLVEDDLTCSLNTCSSESNDILLGH